MPRRTAQHPSEYARQQPSESPAPSSNATEIEQPEELYTDEIEGELEEEGFEEELEEDHGDHGESILDGGNVPGDASSIGLEDLKEIGALASWTVSTAKPGCGVEQLRDEDTNLYWQSDGPQPHTISIHFAKRVFVSKMRLYLDHDLDESYTPTKISIASGTGYHDLQEVMIMNLEQPKGWINVDLVGVGPGLILGSDLLKTYLIEVKIHANHQNGKDTHIRGLQIFSNEYETQADTDLAFTASSMLAELEIR
ncbi:APC10-domain-containing protein [Ascobolus immersus RN42]|uniref:APC10-domain-containing protein n=1 Tax=Ascobolus immersus RN42 TaxID=1160509 RepID=A0A3N4HTM8_ASCIM|nr:APC10-domain-containing protein [Ascobolus immersus RN42]